MTEYLTVCYSPNGNRADTFISKSLMAARKKGIAFIGNDRKAEAEIFTGRVVEYGRKNLCERMRFVETTYVIRGVPVTDRDYATQMFKNGAWQGFKIVMPNGMLKRE